MVDAPSSIAGGSVERATALEGDGSYGAFLQYVEVESEKNGGVA